MTRIAMFLSVFSVKSVVISYRSLQSATEDRRHL
jgi:hypothetical protein